MRIQVQSRAQRLSFIAPLIAFLELRKRWGTENVALLESLSGPERDMQSSLIAFGPVLTVTVKDTLVHLAGTDEVRALVAKRLLESSVVAAADGGYRMRDATALWELLRTVQGVFQCPDNAGDSFQFGFIGHLAYDVARSIERLPYRITEGSDEATASFTVYRGLALFDLVNHQTTLLSHSSPDFWQDIPFEETVSALAALEGVGHDATSRAPAPPAAPQPRAVKHKMRYPEYRDKVAQALHYIKIGDIYQVQLGHQIEVESDIDVLDVYQRLRTRNPSPYMYLIPSGPLTLVGASPESFIKVEKGKILMRPLAGTTRRGKDAEDDARLSRALLSNEKEVAEHIMLVDLCRNDIGRVCEAGTLRVTELLVVEQYSHVHHLVSSVQGQLRPDFDAFNAIAATFPAGTMTGAPKIRAMEVIEELETTRRGAYAGAVGLVDFGGYVNLALLIRSAIYSNKRYLLRASAGVVADSIAENEWRETLHKMGSTYWATTGEELNSEGHFG